MSLKYEPSSGCPRRGIRRRRRTSRSSACKRSRFKEAGSNLRRIGSCITQFKAQGRSRICHESTEEEVRGVSSSRQSSTSSHRASRSSACKGFSRWFSRGARQGFSRWFSREKGPVFRVWGHSSTSSHSTARRSACTGCEFRERFRGGLVFKTHRLCITHI